MDLTDLPEELDEAKSDRQEKEDEAQTEGDQDLIKQRMGSYFQRYNKYKRKAKRKMKKLKDKNYEESQSAASKDLDLGELADEGPLRISEYLRR